MVNSNLIAQNDGISAFLLKWENSKNYLLEIAEAMPEANYNFKPTERQMSFKEQLLHIRQNMVWLSESYFMENGEKSKKIESKTKELFPRIFPIDKIIITKVYFILILLD